MIWMKQNMKNRSDERPDGKKEFRLYRFACPSQGKS